jgi:hypothetical protein
MLIRPKYHWLSLLQSVLFLLFAIFIVGRRPDHFLVPFYLAISFISFVGWSTSYTTLRDGVLKRRIFLFTYRSFPVNEIASVQPHPKHGKWGYGVVVTVWSKSGKKLTLQPNHPQAFLDLLRHEASQAEFLL